MHVPVLSSPRSLHAYLTMSYVIYVILMCNSICSSNGSVEIWNAILRKLNINVSLYKCKYYVKLFLLEIELLITYYY